MYKTQCSSLTKEQYISPEVCLFEIEIEKGFLNSSANEIPGFDDNGAPGIGRGNNLRTNFPEHSF